MQIVIGNNIRGKRSNKPATPFAKMTNQSWNGGLAGLFSFNFYLKESDNSTPLSSGDTVEITVRDGATIIEKIEGTVGVDTGTFTPVPGSPTPTSSITNWMTGTVQDGGFVQLAKKQWADANSYNYVSGSVSGSNWDSAAVILTLEVKATDLSTGVTSGNVDNKMNFERVVDLIEASIFWQYTISGGGQDLVYSMHDNDGISAGLLSQTTYQKTKDGVIVDSSLPSFTTTSFTWGTRDLAYISRADTNGYMEQTLGFSNGMTARNYFYVGSPANAAIGFAYNRLLSGTQKAETFTQKLESGVSSTVIERAMRNANNIVPEAPLNSVDVYINGSFDQNINNFASTGVNSSECPWFDLDMGSVGQRNTIRFESVFSPSYNAYNEFQLEINYVY